MAGNSTRPGKSVASRLLALLSAFDSEHQSLSLSDLARRADLPLATAYRLVRELAEWGALVRGSSGAYVVGRRLWDLGLLAPVQSELCQIASPFLHDIHSATLATVHLAVRDGSAALYVDRLSGHASVRVVSDIGSRLPLHATGVGKVLLAYAPNEVHAHVFANLTRITPYTVTQPGRLREEIHRVHQEGYAQTTEEMTLGACSTAVPVIGPDDAVVAALDIVVPPLQRDRPRLLAVLQEAAKGVSHSLARRFHSVKNCDGSAVRRRIH